MNHPSMPGYNPLKGVDDTLPPDPPNPNVRRTKVQGCTTCESYKGMGPAHDASRNCASGKRSHCSCDTCF